MNLLDIETLLPELRELVTELSEDLLARVNANPETNAGLKDAFRQIEKGGRTEQVYEIWLEDYLDQVAVAWVLSCIFVRFMEDNELIDECWIAGEGDRRAKAEDNHTLYFRSHPHESDREYFEHLFKEIGKIPAASELFAEGNTPLWAVEPSGDAAMSLLKFWREIDTETGRLKRTFRVHAKDTRFLGDLYQELSERAKKKYALLQTPVFVEEFILDRTFTPAIGEFGLEAFRMIDPTCGSGHFLLGGFARLFELFSQRENNEIVAAQKALDCVWGVDINPFAVAIARFRLIVAAINACGITRLKQAPGWRIHLASGDSLLFGSNRSLGGERLAIAQQLNLFEVPTIYAVEDVCTLQHILGQGYHVVVGNPPYITVKDKAQNDAYRKIYSTCHRQYSLGVPFTERFWGLAIQKGEGNAVEGGYIGMITTNSFMKREFGKPLIEQFFPTVDLSHVIDTSGAYIPGHGTPTVILFGRARKPVGVSVRAVLGIKGEPCTPDDPSQGLVWRSIVDQVDVVGAQDAYTSIADVPRATFAIHPWSIGGGGAAELKEQLDEEGSISLAHVVEPPIGRAVRIGEENAFTFDICEWTRKHLPKTAYRVFAKGEDVRDWSFVPSSGVYYPYSSAEEASCPSEIAFALWPQRTTLKLRPTFQGTFESSGMKWFEYQQHTRSAYRTPFSIMFPNIASHNHFVLDRGGTIFDCTAPIIKLPAMATEEEHLALLGLLNSSTACFWMKQVSHQKQMMGGDGIRISSRAKVPYQFAGTRLLEMPIPKRFLEGPFRARIQHLATHLDQLSNEMGSLTASNAIEQGSASGESRIRSLLQEFEAQRVRIRSLMILLQEEIDFTVYVVFGLVAESLLLDVKDWPSIQLNTGSRPFEILQQSNLDNYPVPKGIPAEWPEALQELWRKRMEAIQCSKEITLIEDDQYKRRWIGRQGLFNHTARQNELESACEEWLLARLEQPTYRKGTKDRVELTTIAQMAEIAGGDAAFLQIGSLYRGRSDFDLIALVAELVEGEAVPFLPILRYKLAGVRKRKIWERTWELQRQEDVGKVLRDIAVPPKYAMSDFAKGDYWRLRGKLDIPKERWISYPHCSIDGDATLVVGWAGWNHLEQATALVAYYDARKREGWDAKRLTPLLAGLDQLLPWIHQWHPETDPEYGESAGQSFQHMLEADAHELGLTIEDIRNWVPPEKAKAVRRKKVEA